MSLESLEGLYQALDDEPDDWVLWGLLADWYEEHGELHEAECSRWMYDTRTRPRTGRNNDTPENNWSWYPIGCWMKNKEDVESNIPDELFRELSTKNPVSKGFSSLRKAIEKLFLAWSKTSVPSEGALVTGLWE